MILFAVVVVVVVVWRCRCCWYFYFCVDLFVVVNIAVLLHRYFFIIRTGTADTQVSLSAFSYLYSELVQYHQNRVDSISELERRLESSGYQVGLKVLELITYRNREVRDTKREELDLYNNKKSFIKISFLLAASG
jgi:hypothetical protein